MDGEARRLLVIGLDCLEPSLVFEHWRSDLPNLSRLMANGAFGRLRSAEPPITVPAWSSMLSSRDPGQLGFYGFRNRAGYTYEEMAIANANAVRAPRVWDVLGDAGKRSIVIGVPQTYPIYPLKGYLISDFLTPPNPKRWTFPESLAAEITGVLDGEMYEFDVKGFRTNDKAWLLDSIYRMTRKRWQAARYLIQNKPWDFFMMVEMGTDRIHHGFWSFMDPEHFRYEPGNPFEQAIHDYYVHVDGEIGKLLALVGDETIVVVVSDHGAQRMDGGFCVNDWLVQHGYLAIAGKPDGIVDLKECQVDWQRTRAWSGGGYYARVFLNVEGREPQGSIPAAQYEAERDRLKKELEDAAGPDGKPLGNIVLKPQDIYREVTGIAPDLIVYFGGLYWRSVGTVGNPSVFTRENDTGPDDANHAPYGTVILYDPQAPARGQRIDGYQLESIGPTLLDLLDVPIPATMMGKPIAVQPEAVSSAAVEPNGESATRDEGLGSGYTEEEEASISDHLASLGYL